MKIYYSDKQQLFEFNLKSEYPIVKPSNTNGNVILVVDSLKNSYCLSPKLILKKLVKIPEFKNPKKNDNIDSNYYSELIRIYNKYISDIFCCDFSISSFSKSAKILNDVDYNLQKMRLDKEVFIDFCFYNSSDMLIPNSNRIKAMLHTYDKKYKKSFNLLIDTIQYQLDNYGVSNFDDLHPCIRVLHPDIYKKIKCLVSSDEKLNELIVAYFIVTNYTALRYKILESNLYKSLKKINIKNNS
jgi:hypothetical protein